MHEDSCHISADIFQRFLKGDEKAFREVYSILYGQLCYFGERLVLSREAAEEIVVDVFVKTHRLKPAFSDPSHLRGYLFEAVKNQSLNFLKREKRYVQHLHTYIDSILVNIKEARNEWVETTFLELIFHAAGDLPAECKRIFDLLYHDQLTYQEVAITLNLNVQTVRNQNARAIAHIRKKLNTRSA